MGNKNFTQHIIDSFTADNKAYTINHLLKTYSCSEVTLRRQIKQIGMLVSYNFNSKFYTLYSLASFNEYGIWDYQGILFSIHGTLTKTIKNLIDNSELGYTPLELSLILHVSVKDLLRVQTGKENFKRIKIGREYTYFNPKEQVFSKQYEKRQLFISSLLNKETSEILKHKDFVIAILIEIIYSGKLDAEFLQQVLSKKTVSVSVSEIQSVISHFGLKKTIVKL